MLHHECLDFDLACQGFSWLLGLFPFKNDPGFVETLNPLLLAYATEEVGLLQLFGYVCSELAFGTFVIQIRIKSPHLKGSRFCKASA